MLCSTDNLFHCQRAVVSFSKRNRLRYASNEQHRKARLLEIRPVCHARPCDARRRGVFHRKERLRGLYNKYNRSRQFDRAVNDLSILQANLWDGWSFEFRPCLSSTGTYDSVKLLLLLRSNDILMPATEPPPLPSRRFP